MKQYAEAAVSWEAKFQGHKIKQKPDDKQTASPTQLSSRSEDSAKISEDDKKKKKKKTRSKYSKHSSSMECDSSKWSSDDNKFDLHNNGFRGVKVLKTRHTNYIEATHLVTYCLIFQSQEYNPHIAENIGTWVKRMNTQIKTAIFRPSDSISILSFLWNFKTARDSNEIDEGAPMWLFLIFIKEPSRATLAHRMSASIEGNAHREGKLTSYCLLIDYLLEAYATYDVIAETEAEVTNCKQSENMSAVHYTQTLWENALRCGLVYSKSRFKGAFIPELNHSIRFAMSNCWSAYQEPALQNMTRYATSLSNLQEGTNINCITSHIHKHSPEKLLNNNNWERCPTIMMPIADRYKNKSSSSSVETPSR